jgi:hypothetical protein
MKRIPEVGDIVEDYIYGTGVSLKGTIIVVNALTVNISEMSNDAGWFQKLIMGDPGKFPAQEVNITDLDYSGDHWCLDSFL